MEQTSEPKPKQSALQRFNAFWRRLVDLTDGLDREGAVFSIRNNRKMEGANAWMLMCSIIIASLGLDLNSPAVIIGAMLISPLMSPILGIGLSVATNDYETLMLSIKHFSIAIGIAIITSTLYFSISPLGELTNEILSRTSPTLLDVGIGFFGGIAGIISVSRKDQTSAIPGVAIATALMPPLCVTGFGLATGNMNIALASFYLFFLNTFFVALATYVMVRLLGFPSMRKLTETARSRKTWSLILVTLVILIPSVWIFVRVIQENNVNNRVRDFINSQFEGNLRDAIDDWNLVRTDSSDHLVIKVYGSDISDPAFWDFEENLSNNELDNVVVDIIPTSEVDLNKIRQIEAQISNFQFVADQLTRTRQARSQQDILIDSLRSRIDAIQSDTIPFLQISKELRTIFPDLESAGFSKLQYNDFTEYHSRLPTLVIQWRANKSNSSKRSDKAKMQEFITTRTGIPDVVIIER